MSSPPADPRDCLSRYLGTRTLGRAHRHFERIGSTNDEAASWQEQGAPHGAVVTADAQTAGRGRMGRTWSSPPGLDLYASLILSPGEPSVGIGAMGLAVGAGLRAGLVSMPAFSRLPVVLKWPNDLMLEGGKLGGILCETKWQGARPQIVAGFGINVGRREFDSDLEARATSLALHVSEQALPDRWQIFAAMLDALEPLLERFWRGGFPAIRADYAPHCSVLGEVVTVPVSRPDGSRDRIHARAIDLDEDGALRVQSLAGGEPFRVENADVWLARAES